MQRSTVLRDHVSFQYNTEQSTVLRDASSQYSGLLYGEMYSSNMNTVCECDYRLYS